MGTLLQNGSFNKQQYILVKQLKIHVNQILPFKANWINFAFRILAAPEYGKLQGSYLVCKLIHL